MDSEFPTRISPAITQTVSQVKPVSPSDKAADEKRQDVSADGQAVPQDDSEKMRSKQQELEQVVSKMSDFVQSLERDLNFSIDESSGRTVIKVIDSQSDEVIRQIPSEEALALLRRQVEGKNDDPRGLLFENKA